MKLVEISKCVVKTTNWSPSVEIPEGEFDYVDLSSLDKEEKIISRELVQRLPGKDAPSRARQLVETNDVLVATVRPNLNGVAVVNSGLKNGTASTGYCVLRPNKELHHRYLFYWVRSKAFISDMIRKATGANYPAVSDSVIKKSKIPLPPLVEQKKIAAILDAADSLRKKDKALIAKYEELTQSLFLDMFGNLSSFKMAPLKELVTFIDYRGKSPNKATSGVPLLTAKNVKKGHLSIEPQEFILNDDYDNWMVRGFPKTNDVLFTTEAPLGQAALLPHYEKVAIAQRIICLQPKEAINSTFLMNCILSNYFQNELNKKATGSTAKGIRSKELAKIKTPVPPIDLQNKFAKRFQEIEKQKRHAQQSLQKSEELFNSLLQRAFKGELTKTLEPA